jgi:hypothetical protein
VGRLRGGGGRRRGGHPVLPRCPPSGFNSRPHPDFDGATSHIARCWVHPGPPGSAGRRSLWPQPTTAPRPDAVGSWPPHPSGNLQPSSRFHGSSLCRSGNRAHRHGMLMASRWCGGVVRPCGVDSDAPWASRHLLPWRHAFRRRSTVAASTASPPRTGLRGAVSPQGASVIVVSGTLLGTADGRARRRPRLPHGLSHRATKICARAVVHASRR